MSACGTRRSGAVPMYPNLSNAQKHNCTTLRLMCDYNILLDRLFQNDMQCWSAYWFPGNGIISRKCSGEMWAIVCQFLVRDTLREYLIVEEYRGKMRRCKFTGRNHANWLRIAVSHDSHVLVTRHFFQ